jgi:hypothetical protein
VTRERPDGDHEAFLERWSRRKQEAGGTVPRGETADGGRAEGPGTKAAELTDADMPPLTALTEDSDYAPFLSPRVSEGLRRLALRKLFHGPRFNLRDGLDDYDQDFTGFAKLGDLVTADLRFRLQQEARRLAQAELEAADRGGPGPRERTVAADEDGEPASDTPPEGREAEG